MSDPNRIALAERLLVNAAHKASISLSGDMRVSEADAAVLLGLHPGSLKNLRHEGSGPRAYRLGLNGGRLSYRIADLAEWLEVRSVE